MGLDSGAILEEALNCFQPKIPLESRPDALMGLQELAMNYSQLIEIGIKAFPPVSKLDEPSAEYEARRQEVQFPRPRRGRPREFAADILVLNCRDMLMEHGCSFAATHDRDIYQSPLVELAKLLHQLAGQPPCGGWQERAELSSDPGWRLKLRFGEQFDLTGVTPEWKRAINRAEARPAKRKS